MAVEFVLHLSVGDPKPVISSWYDAGLTFASFLICVPVAAASWYFFESKSIQLGKKATYWANDRKRVCLAREPVSRKERMRISFFSLKNSVSFALPENLCFIPVDVWLQKC